MPVSTLTDLDLREDHINGFLQKVNEIISEGVGGGATVYNVTSYGAAGTGEADDTAAIQSAVNACAETGGMVYLPNGTYLISKSASSSGCLLMRDNVHLVGESKEGVILFMADGQPSFTRPVMVESVKHWSIRNLTIDGNKANQSVQEHRAGIFIWKGDGSSISPQYGYIADVIIRNNSGDAVHLHQDCEDIVMERCYCHDNDRRGVAVSAGGQRRCTLRDCWFIDNYGTLHIEPQTPVEDLLIDGCYCAENADDLGYVLSLGGPGSGIARTSGLVVRDCVIKGCVQVAYAENARLVSNRILPSENLLTAPVVVNLDCVNVLIDGNEIVLPANANSIDSAVYVQGTVDAATYYQPVDVRIVNNRITTEYGLGAGVALVNAHSAIVQGNSIVNTAGNCTGVGIGISATIQALPMDTFLIANNYIYDYDVAVRAGGTSALMSIESLTLAGNVVRKGTNAHADNAWDLNYLGFGSVQQCAVFGNDVVGVGAFESYPQVPVLTGGTRGGGGIYSCTGTPEGAITEVVGAMALRRDGGASTTLYVKTSGTGNTGWTAK